MSATAELEVVQLADTREVVVNITNEPELQPVLDALGVDWTWQAFELGNLTDEDGTVTEWLTLHSAARK